MIKAIVCLCLFFCTACFAQPTKKWGDTKDGYYANPLLPADFSDIDVIRVGTDYYAISSTFQFSPGVVVLHSNDLVNWQIVGHVASDITTISPELNYTRMNRYGRGVWAGAIRYHNHKFWVYFGTPDEGFFMSTATNAAGPWAPLHQVWNTQGWDDGCPFWDDDGQGYFIATHFADNYTIHLFKLSEDGKEIVLKSASVIHQSEGSEANKLYKIKGIYYHFYSEVKPEGRVAMIERSATIYGPYETKQLNHVNPTIDKEPNQGGLVQTPSGGWWFFTHQGTGSWEGRAACLLPVTWINGWPIIGEVGNDTIGNMVWRYKKPMASKANISLQTSDEFTASTLAVQWEWNYQPRAEKWSLTKHKNWLRLYAFMPANRVDTSDKKALFYRAGNTLTQRSMRTKRNTVIIKINISGMADGECAGLCHFSETYSHFGVKQASGVRRLWMMNNEKEMEGIAIKQNNIWLRSIWNENAESQYWYSFDGKTFTSFGDTYQLTWGFYRGDRVGIFNYNAIAEKGFVDVDWWRYTYAH